jgi:hypothetical protein
MRHLLQARRIPGNTVSVVSMRFSPRAFDFCFDVIHAGGISDSDYDVKLPLYPKHCLPAKLSFCTMTDIK